jgi:phosphatidylinositol alpha 1,6-mannosyltransferase
MRVAILTESYAPDLNGVANSVMRVCDHLLAKGHSPMVIAPRPRRRSMGLPHDPAVPVHRVGSFPTPGHTSFRIAKPSRLVKKALRAQQPDVVHLASPFVLGAWGARAAADLGIPVVAVYQTEIPGYADAYGLGPLREIAWRWIADIHGRADVTLAPSTVTAANLTARGVPRVKRWGRGVDAELFRPSRRSVRWRQDLAAGGEILVGYIGRIAHEKRLDLLRDVTRLPGVRLVVVGDGPTRWAVERALPAATFLGSRSGLELAQIYASLDIFVHPGTHETFCQTIQEAHASGVPVVAPSVGGPLDLVEPGVTGFLVPPGDAAGLAATVAELAADPALRERMGLAARQAVAGRTWSALVDELLGHYHHAIMRSELRRSEPARTAT